MITDFALKDYRPTNSKESFSSGLEPSTGLPTISETNEPLDKKIRYSFPASEQAFISLGSCVFIMTQKPNQDDGKSNLTQSGVVVELYLSSCLRDFFIG
ncbi:hypothetical protein NPIL_608801 [Nephila pilipes]|uniref:Uncharacterized protein n=1 Tax=Nephila pilipes TaxID=299642 RepID=A0A8X6K554_NEPPI|nr:hypothetical protein NPIL_608801 [Nephila pilipes]